MKHLLLPAVMLFLLPVMASAQNSVTVVQNGNHNSVTIHQTTAAEQSKNCVDSLAVAGNKNIILIKKPSGGDTVLTKSGVQYYYFSKIFTSNTTLRTYQKGKQNVLHVLLADSSNTVHHLHSSQKGQSNKALVRFSYVPSEVRITQKGAHNTFLLNPCAAPDRKR